MVTTWISSKLNHNGKGHVLPTVIQFHVYRTSIVKVIFNRNSGERLAPDTHFTAASLKSPPAFPGSAQTSCFSFSTPVQHSLTAENYSNACYKLLKTIFLAAGSVLCKLDGQESLFFRVARIGVKQNFRVSSSTLI